MLRPTLNSQSQCPSSSVIIVIFFRFQTDFMELFHWYFYLPPSLPPCVFNIFGNRCVLFTAHFYVISHFINLPLSNLCYFLLKCRSKYIQLKTLIFNYLSCIRLIRFPRFNSGSKNLHEFFIIQSTLPKQISIKSNLILILYGLVGRPHNRLLRRLHSIILQIFCFLPSPPRLTN
jgi:hypothetical protein